ncbi:MAG TPA: hypothetical protein VFB45_23795 [Pseudolabrys sp.]|nr:hypothetical protein [Pseudolabrys sp.]
MRIAVALIVLVACCNPGSAAPATCSNEYNACIVSCMQVVGAKPLACKTTCRDRQKACMISGCWNTGMKTYCGLSKQ